jgi:phosphate uptake regulator
VVYVKGIARINLLIGEEPLLKPLVEIPRMADRARNMPRRALPVAHGRSGKYICERIVFMVTGEFVELNSLLAAED